MKRKVARAAITLTIQIVLAQGLVWAQTGSISSMEQQVLDSITSQSVEGHLEFLASDALGGRNTPSPGLDLAALYIATEFKRIGLEPAGGDGYFQTSEWELSVIERERRTPTGERRIMRSRRPVPVGTSENVEGEPFTLKNVIGLLPGSDPVLKDTYILITAHYDHNGIRSGSYPDSILNGANDNGSGTIGVIEIASALSKLEPRPKRSILFITWFGEEKGLLGAREFVENPVVPLEKIIAMVNMEMIGRTDGDGGDQTNRASFTGFDFSSMPQSFVEAGKALNMEVHNHPEFSNPYFRGSDNIAFATAGVVAHTICVLYQYDDYHQVGDNWDKIDYPNMTRTIKLLTLGLIRLANNDHEPRWNEDNPDAERYLQAWRVLHGKG